MATKQTPILRFKIRIKSAKHLNSSEPIEGFGYTPTQFSKGKLEYIKMKGGANWYNDQIGSEFYAMEFDETYLRIDNGFGCGFYFINKKDCMFI